MDPNGAEGETARILVEFLEVAITSIVFHKALYPSGAFERRRYVNVVVQRARHPQLRDYIYSAVNGLHPFILKGLVERVAVIFFNTDNVPVEKYIFKLNINKSYSSNVEEGALELTLRSFLIKLSVSQSLSRVLPHGKLYIHDHLIAGGRSQLTSIPFRRLVQARMQTYGSPQIQSNGNNLH